MDFKIISFIEPQNVFSGRLWIKPDLVSKQAQVFMRLGDSWIPQAGGDLPDDFLARIRATDRTIILINGYPVHCEKGSLNTDDILANQVDTCSFTLPPNTFREVPQVGNEVLVFHKPSFDDDFQLRFGGRITTANQKRVAPMQYAYDISCSDYTTDLHRTQITETYSGVTEGYIIRDIISKYVPELGTAFVAEGETIEFISFSWQFPDECLAKLCGDTGMSWYVDAERNLHYFARDTNTAPYVLTDEHLIGGQYKDLSITPDKSQLRNVQVVQGGYEYSDLFTDDIQQAIDGQTIFSFKYTPYAPVTIWINGVQKSCGIENVDTSGYDFVMNQSEKTFKCLDHAALNAGDLVNPRYKYQIKIFARVQDGDSIKAMKAIEGGTGIYEGPLIVDDTIQTKLAARLRAQSEIDVYGNPLVNGSFVTNQFGYRSGQILTINIPSRGVNIKCLIQEVSAQSVAGGLFEYTVTFATKLKGLMQYLIYLYDNGKKVAEDTTVVIDRLENTQETVLVSDIPATSAMRNPTTRPYTYGPDADAGRYGLCQYA